MVNLYLVISSLDGDKGHGQMQAAFVDKWCCERC